MEMYFEKNKDEYWLGFANDYPEYCTQAFSLDELLENISDIYKDVEKELIPGKRMEMEFELV